MNIWVIAENTTLAAELISGAKEKAKDAVVTAFVGADAAAAQALFSLGADKVVALPILDANLWEAYTKPLAEQAKTEAPYIIMIGATKRGKDIAAQMAAILDVPCVSDCKNIAFEGGKLQVARMIYGGMALQTMSTAAATTIMTIGAKTYDPLPADASKTGTVTTMQPGACAVKVTKREGKATGTVNLGDATRVVGIGRGFVEESETQLAKDLAAALGAEMACSRPIAEFFKWMPEETYLGISGQSIKPLLYVAAGVSGQVQHTYGVRDAKVIVSINKDENAPMMLMSDYFIVGDIKEVLPALTAAFKN